MNRKKVLELIAAGLFPMLLPKKLGAMRRLFLDEIPEFSASDFGDFTWGVSTSAAQTEGAWNMDGRGASIWDIYAQNKGKIKDNSRPEIASDFYHQYPNDLEMVQKMGFGAFRFSISWSRILPDGKGKINQKGIDFYNCVIDACLEKGLVPWITLYHWDLPHALELEGGWTNRNMVEWFSNYVALCAKSFGDRVKNWIVLNEPMAFTSLGYGLGYHAPGKKGINSFLSAAHHTALCQAEGGRVLRAGVKLAKIGSSFSCSPIDTRHANVADENAAARLDALMNRFFVEPAVGLGYPVKTLPFLRKMEPFIKQNDESLLKFDFDFLGIQNYFRVVAGYSPWIPYLHARPHRPTQKQSEFTEMDWEIYPEGMYRILMQFSKYPVKELVVTENGAAFHDRIEANEINDAQRVLYYKKYLQNVLKAKKDGANIQGYFAWTLVDNFEWTEGFRPKFGLVHFDSKTQQRRMKKSGLWFKEFLSSP